MAVRKANLTAHETDKVKGANAVRRIARGSAVCGLVVLFVGVALLFVPLCQ